LVTAPVTHSVELEDALAGCGLVRIGTVTQEDAVIFHRNNREILRLTVAQILSAWQRRI
jgi:hypothetical protein